jgi:DNA ligase-1
MEDHLLPALSRRVFVAGLALCATWRAGARDALPPLAPMLAREASPGMTPNGWLVSEKYDGVRALWDGGQLRFRSGRPVPAPDWFLAFLPAQALDGELWLAHGRFDALSATVRRESPRDEEWRQVRYMVFDLPRLQAPFEQRAANLRALLSRTGGSPLVAVGQQRMSNAAALARRMDEVVAAGGEGLMLHRADAPYVAGRSDALLKLKPVQDAEAIVVGHVPGRGRHAGRLGALRVRTDEGLEFRLGTGLSDAEREAPPPPGAVVTYTYRGLTPAGLPRFASFLRVREWPASEHLGSVIGQP